MSLEREDVRLQRRQGELGVLPIQTILDDGEGHHQSGEHDREAERPRNPSDGSADPMEQTAV
jgi:hypothetical protein